MFWLQNGCCVFYKVGNIKKVLIGTKNMIIILGGSIKDIIDAQMVTQKASHVKIV